MRKSLGRILIGLAFIAAGFGFFGEMVGLWDDFTIFFKGWWTLFIIVPSFISLVSNRFSFTNLAFLISGGLFLANAWVPNIITWNIVWTSIVTMIFVFIGLKIIFRNSFGRTATKIKEFKLKNPTEIDAVFSSQTASYDEIVFTGLETSAVFGGVKIDLTKAIINSDCVIEASAVFGGIDIFLPNNINYKINSTCVFGGISDKKRNTKIENAPTIYIEGNAIFGGIDIN